ncbi:MAG: Nramp family divalent metal transporter [Acidobacteriota bacterium]
MRWLHASPLRHLGPGMLLAATSIGSSHILMSPEAGARFGYSLLWLVVAAHLVKYPAFELAPRYVAARGESLLDAYARAPGPKNWAIWLGIADMTAQGVGVIAALVGLTATFVVEAFGVGGVASWSLALTALLLLLLRFGHYAALRGINLALLVLLSAGTLLAFSAAPPEPTAFASGLVPVLPDGSLFLIAAILGFMPTSVAVSVWQSLWALEQGRFGDPSDAPEDRRRHLRRGLFDLRLGYGLSALLAVCFLSLGATLLAPRGLVPEGTEVALVLSRLYTLVLGDWMRPVVLAMAFAALFTTCYTLMDGLPRSFVAARHVLAGRPAHAAADPHAEVDRLYWTFLLPVTFGGMAILALLPDPAFLVKAVAVLGLLLSPVYYILNLWAVLRLVDDPALRPGRASVALSIAGIVSLMFAAGLVLATSFGAGA